ncbi:MAG: hypothetical protein ACKV0T_01020 [Planctomycetales bacterium]
MNPSAPGSRTPPPVAAFLLVALVVALGQFAGRSGNDPFSTLERNLAGLADKYSLELVARTPRFPVQTAHGQITGERASPEELARFGEILREEWNLYPVELIQKTGLKRLVLCTNLAFAGQHRTAIPDFEHDDLYFDVHRGGHSADYERKVIHHEFFHIIDLRDDGSLYSDPRWESLLPEGTRYGRGGETVQDDSSQSLPDDSVPGFLNKYSTIGVEEDKAEMYANLVVDARAVEVRAATDPLIGEKADQMRRLLEAFCPQMDESFWDAARRLNRTHR